MKYNHKDAIQCLPEGDYDASLKGYEETQSSKGSDMIVVEVEVYGQNGKSLTLKDYITVPAALWKLKRLASALGKSQEFVSGDTSLWLDPAIGNNFKVTLAVEDSDQYGEQNRIKAYLKPGESAPAGRKLTAAEAPIKDEDIPF